MSPSNSELVAFKKTQLPQYCCGYEFIKMLYSVFFNCGQPLVFCFALFPWSAPNSLQFERSALSAGPGEHTHMLKLDATYQSIAGDRKKMQKCDIFLPNFQLSISSSPAPSSCLPHPLPPKNYFFKITPNIFSWDHWPWISDKEFFSSWIPYHVQRYAFPLIPWGCLERI